MKMIVLIAAVVLSASATPILAEGGENHARVEYKDLNLASQAGRATFDKRLNNAVRQVCRSGPTRSIRAAMEARECIVDAKARVAPLREALFADAIKAQFPEALAIRAEP